ncbi:MAG: phasin family protein [Proteobacteria bacterium]|nr:phasin family protein [Pseudomonadota bacterium]
MPTPNADKAPRAQAPGLAPGDDMQQLNTAFWHGFQSFQRQSADFLTRRLDEDRTFFANAMTCKDAAEFTALQQRWLAEMGEAYVEHGRAMLSLMLPESDAEQARP